MNAKLKNELQSKARKSAGVCDQLINLRVSSKQKSAIKKKAKEMGLSMSKYLLGLHEHFR